ncbi:MAG: PAS domain S-box protein, partial [Chthoniobacterales bacterium]
MKSKKSTGANPVEARTGIEGFDEITHGGLPSDRTTLLEGDPGSGETLTARQTLAHGARHDDEPGTFVDHEERTDRSPNRTFTLSAGISVAALGGAALAGWVLQVEALKAIVPGCGVLAPNLAVGMFLCGGALALLSRKTLPRPAQICAAAMSVTVIIMGLLVLSEYLFGWKLGIEEWPVGLTGRLGVLHPERVTPTTAVSFLVLSIILFECRSIQTRLGLSIAAGLSGAHAVIAVIALAAPSLRMSIGASGSYSALDITGVPGAIGFLLLSSGLFALLRRKGALRWSIDPVTTSAFGFGILLLLIAAGAALSFTTRMLETTESLTHRQEVLKKTQEIMTTMLELESAERAYIITGDVRLRTRRESAKASLDEKMLQIRQLTSNDPMQQRRLDQLEPLIAQRIDWEDDAIRLRREGAFSEAAQMVAGGNGLKLSGEISAVLEQMQNSENESLANDQKRATAATTTAFLVLPLGVLVSLIILSVGLLLLNSGMREQKEAESGLRLAEEKYRSIFEQTSEGIFQNTLEGAFLSANPALARILGYDTPQQLIDDRIDVQQQGYVDPAQREKFKQILAEHGAVKGFEYQVQRKDKSRIWVSENAHLVRDAHALPLYYEGSVQDITERKRSEERLQESEKRYRSLFEANPLPMWIYDLKTLAFLEINDAAISHYGYGREEFLSMTTAEIRPAADKAALLAAVARAPDHAIEHAGIWQHRKKDGSLIDV